MQAVVTSKPCSRCGGSGQYSYCERYGTTCFKCGGTGLVACAPKGQKKITPTAELKDCKPGDIIEYLLVFYRVTKIVWCRPRRSGDGWSLYTQAVKVTRLVDDKAFQVYRECLEEEPDKGWGYSQLADAGTGMIRIAPSTRPHIPTPEELGQETDVTYIPASPEQSERIIDSFLKMHPEYTREQVTFFRPRGGN